MQEKAKNRNLSDQQRESILVHLLQHYKHGKLKHGTIGTIAMDFKCNRVTISRLWKQYLNAINSDEEPLACIKSKIKEKSGRRRKLSKEEMQSLLQHVPLEQRNSLRNLAKATGISRSTIFRAKKEGLIQFTAPTYHVVQSASTPLTR